MHVCQWMHIYALFNQFIMFWSQSASKKQMPVERWSWGECNSDHDDVRTKLSRSYIIKVHCWKKNGEILRTLWNPSSRFTTARKSGILFSFFDLFTDKKGEDIDENYYFTDTCKNWIKACNQPHAGKNSFNIRKITYHHYVCSKVMLRHFNLLNATLSLIMQIYVLINNKYKQHFLSNVNVKYACTCNIIPKDKLFKKLICHISLTVW